MFLPENPQLSLSAAFGNVPAESEEDFEDDQCPEECIDARAGCVET